MNTIQYKGDHVKALHNRILGPDADGEFYTVTSSEFANDVTTAQLRPATDDELASPRWDKSGFMYVSES